MSNKYVMIAVVVLVAWFVWHKLGYKTPFTK